jgi:hypothetical protein
MYAYPCGSGSETLIPSLLTQVVGNQNLVDRLLWIGQIDVDVAGRHKVDPSAGYIPHSKKSLTKIKLNYPYPTTYSFNTQTKEDTRTGCSRLLTCVVQEIKEQSVGQIAVGLVGMPLDTVLGTGNWNTFNTKKIDHTSNRPINTHTRFLHYFFPMYLKLDLKTSRSTGIKVNR